MKQINRRCTSQFLENGSLAHGQFLVCNECKPLSVILCDALKIILEFSLYRRDSLLPTREITSSDEFHSIFRADCVLQPIFAAQWMRRVNLFVTLASEKLGG